MLGELRNELETLSVLFRSLNEVVKTRFEGLRTTLQPTNSGHVNSA